MSGQIGEKNPPNHIKNKTEKPFSLQDDSMTDKTDIN